MKCYYHPEKDAVGTCSQCGKAACRDCIDDVGGALLCKDCMAMARQRVVAEKEAASEKAKRNIMWSWVVTVAVGSFAVLIIFQTEIPAIGKIGCSLLAIYATWSTYWGWKAVWPWWRELLSGIGCFLIADLVIWIYVIALFFEIPLIGALIYGCLGGGIYQYLKYRRIAEGRA